MKRARSTLLVAVAMLLCVASSLASASSYFGRRLEEADKARSSNPQKFATMLDELDASRSEASASQLHHLQYLRAYQAVVYRNQLDNGIALAEDLFRETKDPTLKFRVGSLLVNTSALNRKFGEGIRYLNETLSLRDRVRDGEMRRDGLLVASVFYNQLGQYQLGLKYAEEVLADSPSARGRCIAGIYRLEAQDSLDKLPDTDTIRRETQLCLDIGEKMAASFNRVILARALASRGEPDKAIELLEVHLPEIQAIGYPILTAQVLAGLAELKLGKGELAAAERHAVAAIAQASHLVSVLPLVKSHQVLHQVAERRNDPDEALAHYRRYAEADKAYLTDVKSRELAYEIVRHETASQGQQIELLQKQNQVLQLQQAVDRQAAQNSRLLALLLIVLVGLIGYWAYQIKRRHSTLRHQAETDALTGVSNRHHFTIEGARSLAQCAQAGEACALIMFDLDHFKSINDNYGHITGDWVLRRVADTCKTFCRKVDQLGRLGGEEFAILVHGFDASGAARLAEDCRIRIAAIDTAESGYTFAITGSFGVSTTALTGYDLSRLLAHADQMLYRAKREGRNRVCVFTGEAPAPFGTSAHVTSIEALAEEWGEALPSRTRTP